MADEKTNRRLDVQGLRAVASLLVASYHIWFGNVSGGVDVFFAIGGYLLAMSLLRELERTGRVHVPRALWRNMRRLFPMAALVLLVAGTIALIAAWPLGFERVLQDVFAAATYWENWRLAADATDYVAAGHDKSAFQHFWAMGVQGQLTWGLIVLVGLLSVLLRRTRSLALTLGLLLLALGIASFVYAIVRVVDDPVTAYYDTFARAWELLLGAFAALVLARIPLHRAARIVMGVVGLGLVLTAGLLPPAWPQPGWVTLYPVAGALLILLAGEGDQSTPVSRLLRLPGLVWLGGISYGLYLWHWPVLKGFVSAFPNAGLEIDVWEGTAILGLSIALSWASYRLFAVVQGERRAPRRISVSWALPAIAALSVLGLVMAPALQREAIAASLRDVPVASSTGQLSRWIADAAAAPQSPTGGAAVGEDGRAAEWLIDDCVTVGPHAHERCRFDDSRSEREVWIVGDSQAVTWAPAMRAALAGSADLQLLGRAMCPVSSGPAVERQIGSFARICEAHDATVLELAAERRPELVVMTYGAWWVGDGYEDRASDTGTQLAEGTLEYAARLHELGIRTLWLDSPPPFGDPGACLDAHAAEAALDDCTVGLHEARVQRHETLDRVLASGGVEVVDTLGWFCDVEGRSCPLVVQGVPTWADGTHMGAAGSALRRDVLRDALSQHFPAR